MKTNRTLKLLAGLLLLSTISPQLTSALAQGTAFTYQGRLFDNGLPATNIYDMNIALCSTANAPGGQIGSPVVLANVPVTNGLFTVTLNNASEFGANVFDGTARWLEIRVRPGLSTGAYTALSPRQSLLPTPYAIYSGNAATLGGLSATAYVAKAGDTMTGTLNLPPNGLMVGDSADLLYDLVVLNHNVGIGTAGPGALLDVVGNGVLGSTYQQLIQGVGSTLALGANSTAAEIQSKGSSVPLYINHDGNNVVLVDAGVGNVGIGIASPTAKLDVRPIAFSNNQNGGIQMATTDGHWPSGMFLRTDSAGNPRLALDIASTETLSLYGGNVGIGTTTPVAQLDVDGTQGYVRLLSTSSGNGSVLELRNNTVGAGTDGAINFSESDGSVPGQIAYGNSYMSFRAGNVLTMTVGAGFVGLPSQTSIGTSDTTYNLVVNGSAGKPGGGSWSTYSDARLKDVGAEFNRGLTDLEQIQPVHYHYKSENPLKLPSDPEYVGVVAQQVQKAIPEAVERTKDGYLAVNNDPIIWTMLNAVKELKQQNEVLRQRLDQLENSHISQAKSEP